MGFNEEPQGSDTVVVTVFVVEDSITSVVNTVNEVHSSGVVAEVASPGVDSAGVDSAGVDSTGVDSTGVEPVGAV